MVNPEGAPQGAPLWTVGVPRQTQLFDAQKGAVQAWELPITLAGDMTFTITIPVSDFTPEKVQKLVEEHVDRIVAIRSLEGPRY